MVDVKEVLGACPHDCPDTCSMLVKVKDDKVVSVRGNPNHPFTQGRLCVKVNHYQDRVNNPDRVLHPLRRVGKKGSGEFEQISWDEALNEIKTRWTGLIENEGAKSILPYSYLGTQGIVNGLSVADPFFNKLGATISERTFCDSGACTAYAMTIGDSAGLDPESFIHSKYIILWACNTLSTNTHHWPFIEKARKNGAKLVVIDPYRSRTAQQADWHIRIRPGTDGALALGLMNILFSEDLIDHDYVDNYTVGADELRERAAEYSVEFVSKETGIPVEDIQQLAREYASTGPAAVRIGVAIERHSGGGQAVRAISCLPALIGSWRETGGGLLQLPLWLFPMQWDALMRPDFIEDAPRVLNQWKLGQALCGDLELDPPIKSLFVYNSNPVVVAPEQDKIIKGLEREDLFTIVSEHFITDTARYADIILPATTQVEQEDIMFSWGHFYLSYNNKSIEPMGEAVPNVELFRRLARVMGFEDPFFYRTEEEIMRGALDWDSPVLDGITLEGIRKTGYARLNVANADEYAPLAKGGFPTPSGKCEFKSSIAEGGDFVLPIFRQGYGGQQRGTPVDPLPHYIPPHEAAGSNPELAKKYPLNLITPKSHAFINSSYGNQKRQQRHAGEQFILLSVGDAAKRGVVDGDTVLIRNGRGKFQAKLQVSDDVMPGLVVAPVGYWKQEIPGASTVQSLLSSRRADLGGAPTFSDTLVEVEAIATSQAAAG